MGFAIAVNKTVQYAMLHCGECDIDFGVPDRRFFEPYVYIAGAKDRSIGQLLGVPVPPNVANVDVWATKGKIVWHTRNGKCHEMDWPTDGEVTPIIVAMRMSC